MFKQICDGVQWMHAHNYCHLDLSLENTMIADKKTLRVKIIDFGLAKKFEDGNFIIKGRIGKVGYMPPEAYDKKQFDARLADVYCLGIMLFMMLIGAPIYQTPNTQQPAFRYMINGALSEILKHWKRLRIVTVDAIDLLNKILRYEPKRYTLEQVLNHPFITSLKEEEENKNDDNQDTQNEPVQAANDDEPNNQTERPQIQVEDEDTDENENEDEDAKKSEESSASDPQQSQDTEDVDEEETKSIIAGLDDSEDDLDDDVGSGGLDSSNENDDDDNAMMVRYRSVIGNKEIDDNMLCQLLLTEWGLQTCYTKLQRAGICFVFNAKC